MSKDLSFDSLHFYDDDSSDTEEDLLSSATKEDLKNPSSFCCTPSSFRDWNQKLRELNYRQYAWWGRMAVRFPCLFLLFSLSLSLFCGAGVLLRGEEVLDVTVLWLPQGGWQLQDQARYEPVWGRFTLEQVMFTKKVFENGEEVPGKLGNFLTSDKEALLEAYDVIQEMLKVTGVSKNGTVFRFEDLCYKPAEPVDSTCLIYSPFDYWGTREALEEDEDMGLTISPPYAEGELDGLQVPRENIISGMAFEEREGGVVAVVSADVIMLSVFLDFSPSKTNYSDTYSEAVRDWERNLVEASGRERTYVNVFRQTDISIDDEMDRALQTDTYVIFGSIFVVFFLFYTFILIERRENWRIVGVCGMSIVLSILAVYGLAGWFIVADVTVNFPGDGLMFFLLIVIGINHRHLLINRFCETPMSMEPAERVAKIFGEVLPSVAFQLCVTSFPMIIGGVITNVYGMKTYCYAGGIGMLLDNVNIVFWIGGGMANEAKRQYKKVTESKSVNPPLNPSSLSSFIEISLNGRKSSDSSQVPSEPEKNPSEPSKEGLKSSEEKPLLSTLGLGDEFWVPSYAPLSGGPRSWTWKIFQVLLKLPSWVKVLLYFLIFGTISVLIIMSLYFLSVMEVSAARGELAPIDSYLVDFAKLEDEYFSQIGFPLDFYVHDIDHTNPENGPKLFELFDLMKQNEYLNDTQLFSWYVSFTEHCRGARACETINGYPAPSAFEGEVSALTLFLARPENQQFFADIKFETSLPFGEVKFHKFRGNAKHGVFFDYNGQRQGSNSLHELSLSSPAPVTPYASAFPYFHIWEPTQSFLLFLYLPLSFGSIFVLSFLLLTPMVALLLSAHSVLVFFLISGLGFAPFGHGFNMVNAPLVLFIPPVIFDFVIHMAYRYSCMPGPRTTRKAERLLASFYPFAMCLSGLGMGIGVLLFLLSLSSINIFFCEIFECILAFSIFLTLLFFVGMLTLPLRFQLLVLCFLALSALVPSLLLWL